MLLVFLLAVGPLTAQDEQSFSSQATLVVVPTLVRDASGSAVYGLTARDFIVEDDGIEQAVRMEEAAESSPISLMIALQCGRRAKRELSRMVGLASLLDPILSNPDNEAALLVFDSKLDLVRDFTNNPDMIEGDLKSHRSGDGGAAISDAIAYSARLLARRPEGRQRVLLLISETRDHGSHFAKLDEVVRLIDENGVSVYALPFSPYISQQLDAVRGTNKDEWSANIDILGKLEDIRQGMRNNIPKTLATLTGGEYGLFATRDGFENDLISFANHLHSRYLLSFEPKDPHPGLHQIRVRLRSPKGNISVLHRSNYWAGAPETNAR
jgi:VWFA-related protein